MQDIVIIIQGPHSENSCTREKRFAHGERGGCIDLQVIRERGEYRVIWNANSGLGWRAQPWRKTRMTEQEATAFAEEKWAVLCDGLRKLEPKSRGNGASAAFSAQVGAMVR